MRVPWRNVGNGNLRCPRCGGHLEYMMEKESGTNGVRVVRYVVRCKYCGYRSIVQEVEMRKAPQGEVIVRRIK